MDALRRLHHNDETVRPTAMYKQAFDILVNTTPSGSLGEVTFDILPREKWYDPHRVAVTADNVEGDRWEDIVGRTLIRPADNPFTDAELAAAILWGATFYGFTSHDRWDPDEGRRETVFSEKIRLLKKRLYLPYARDKALIAYLKGKSSDWETLYNPKTWAAISYRKHHQNGPKRKRLYRMQQSLEWLMKMDTRLRHLEKRRQLIDSLELATGRPLGALADRIINAGAIYEEWRETHGDANRIGYMIDLLSNYFPTAKDLFSIGEELIIVAHTSPSHPLQKEDERALLEFFETFRPVNGLHFFRATDDTIGPELHIRFIDICHDEDIEPYND